MISIGITGGIGSGKTIVCKILEHLDYPVFYADKEAKKNMTENEDLISGIIKIVGRDAYVDKQINRSFLADQIFKNPLIKKKIDTLVHPMVFQSYEKWKQNQKSKFVFNESALLFETGSYKRFDKIFLVTANLETRIKRVIKRDKISREQVLKRISNQLSDSEKIKYNPTIIFNSDNDLLLDQVLKLLNELSN